MTVTDALAILLILGGTIEVYMFSLDKWQANRFTGVSLGFATILIAFMSAHP